METITSAVVVIGVMGAVLMGLVFFERWLKVVGPKIEALVVSLAALKTEPSPSDKVINYIMAQGEEITALQRELHRLSAELAKKDSEINLGRVVERAQLTCDEAARPPRRARNKRSPRREGN